MKSRLSLAAAISLQFLATLFPIISVAAGIGADHPIQAVLDKTCEQATHEQCLEFQDAIAASPSLAKELDDLVIGGLLTTISIVDDSAAPTVGRARFNAAFGNRSMTFTNDFLRQAVGNIQYDVHRDDDLLPNHLVFALGHLARHLRLAPELAEFERKTRLELQAQARDAMRRQVPFDATVFVKAYQQKQLEAEAAAWVAGWNDMIEASTVANQGQPAKPIQVGNLIMNFHYRPVIFQVLNLKVGRPQMDGYGMFSNDERSIAAFVSALKVSPLIDVQ